MPHFPLPYFHGYTEFTSVIPKFYWDVYSAEQRTKEMCRYIQMLIEYCDSQTDIVNGFAEQVAELKALFDKFLESGFDDYYKEQVEKWIDDHLQYIVTKVIRQVYFGLTMEGYFAAYIPESWNDIVFDTGAVFGAEDYGRLILRWDADSPYTVEQP